MKLDKLLFDKDEFLEFWANEMLAQKSQSSGKPPNSDGNSMY